MKLSVIIPAHNEEGSLMDTIERIIKELKGEGIDFEIICVNDNSADRTGKLIKTLSGRHPEVRCVDRQPPVGLGRAVRDGIECAKGDAVVFCMADSSEDPHDITRYFRKLEEGYDCVFGSRFIRGGKVNDYPVIKLFLNRLANNMIRLMFLTKFNDITNAFKMYRIEVLKKCMPFVSLNFNINAEIPLKAVVRRFKIAQIPNNWYGRESGLSKLKISQITRKYLFTIFYVWLESILMKDELNK